MMKINHLKKLVLAAGLGMGLSFTASANYCGVCIDAQGACEVFPGSAICRELALECNRCMFG